MENTTVTINGFEYNFETLPIELQHKIMIRAEWGNELTAARKEVLKLEAALDNVNSSIIAEIAPIESALKANMVNDNE